MADDSTNVKGNNTTVQTFTDNEVSTNTSGDQPDGDSTVSNVDCTDHQQNTKTHDSANGHEFKAPRPSFAVPILSVSLSSKAIISDRSKPILIVSQSNSSHPDHASSDDTLKQSNINSPQINAYYKEPEWGGEADECYSFDVLKNGAIIGNIPLKGQSSFVFGRLQSCDVTLEHPSLSRYHAVIQHSKEESHMQGKGWYIYDLDSTHGTWVNKRKLKPKQYYRLKVGYVIKFGGSSRLHILQGPDDDADEESELSVTELKQQREKQKKEVELLHLNELQETQRQQEAEQKLLQDQGCSWGLAEDAMDNEEENSFATIIPENESTYIDDPKKALKGYYEREGCDLPDYQFTEISMGKHKCRLDLPVDGPNGEELVAEAVVSGKKKDAVIACALEACRILDRLNMLRPSQHESRKRKQKNWEADDFYDSDEDTFLDRTGTIEKKRFMRMKKAGKEKAETYESLMEKYTTISSQISEIEAKLAKAKAEAEALAKQEMDELDAYMFSIKSGAMDTKTRMRLKGELLHLKMEEKHLSKLVNIAKPASMPPLKAEVSEAQKSADSLANRLQLKQLQRKKQRPVMPVAKEVTINMKPDNFEEQDEEEEMEEQEDRQKEEDQEEQQDKATQNVHSQTVSKADIPSFHKKHSPSTPDTVEDMDTTKSSQLPSTQKIPTDSNSDPDSSASKEPQSLPRPSLLAPSIPHKKPHRFSAVQALETLDRPSIKKQTTKPNSQGVEHDPDYATWLPPTDQSGDGRTSLNDKLGY